MPGKTISFARGAPSADILPHDQVREAAARALDSDWETALSYGVGIGHPEATSDYRRRALTDLEKRVLSF